MEIFIAILAGLFGALLAYLGQTYFAMQSQDSAYLNDHISEIQRIEDYAVAYWLTDQKLDSARLLLHQTKLEGAISASGCFNNDAKRILGKNYQNYVSLDQLIYEAATGGSFSTNLKEIDYNRVVEIMTYCNEMRALLRRSRRQQYWAR